MKGGKMKKQILMFLICAAKALLKCQGKMPLCLFDRKAETL
jgi:hypothetical protein